MREAVLERAQRVLRATQRSDGSWDGACNLGPITTAQAVIVLAKLGRLNAGDASGAARWLRGCQRSDGAFVLYPSAPSGDIGATVCAWAALQVTAPAESRDAITRARVWLDANGGLSRVVDGMELGDFSALFVALAGLLEPSRLQCPSITFLLVPPLMRVLETRFHSGVFMLAFELWAVIRSLQGARSGPVDWLCNRAGLNLMREFQNPDGSWNDSVVLSTLALAALPGAGLRNDEPMLARAIAWLEKQARRDDSGLHFDGFGSEVWATAFDLRAFLEAGIGAADPTVARGVSWLVAAQLEQPMPRVNNRQRGAPLRGGWAFQRSNPTMPDSDDTGVVLSALGLALERGGLEPQLEASVRRTVGRGQDWLWGMQNPDGGWSAYVWGLPGKKPGPALEQTPRVRMGDLVAMAQAFLDPPMPLSDPSTEDVTSRVLHGLGHTGFNSADPRVARALAFLQRQQCENGGWWGRWVLNYLSCTAFALMGLGAVKVDPRAEWVQRAVRFVLRKQNRDGGWGEGPGSYRSPELAGVGPSMPPLTGLVLKGLLDIGERGEAVDRAGAYLTATQRDDGTWPNADYLHVNIPPDTFFIYDEATRFYPPAALGTLARTPSPTPPRWSDARLDALRLVGDGEADGVVKALFDEGGIAKVNALMATLFTTDSPLPPNLPGQAKDYFAKLSVLPAWADRTQLELAEQLFTRAGWQIAMGLFCSSLPQAYCAAHGAHVLTQTQRMTRHVRQRIFETAQFLFDLADEGALQPDGRGIRVALKVRLMHAGVRHLLLARATPAWDSASRGVPINQEDLAGTLMTFSIVTLEAMKKLGVGVGAVEGEAWLHLWQVTGHLLGVHEELIPRDVDAGGELMERIRGRQWAASDDGRALARVLADMMASYFPGVVLDRVPIALIRQLAGDRCADLLGLPQRDWTSALIDAGERFDAALDPQLRLFRFFARATHRVMEGVVLTEREGKQAQFRIPRSLRKTVEGRQRSP